MRHPVLKSLFFIVFFFYLFPAFGQLGNITFDIQKDKPKKFENKTLKSEKTGDKKFTLPRRITQNTVSHYNYYFNANNKLNMVIERARIANKDNYSKILPFYGYSLNSTAAQKTELDSVIYKATAGILIHDLRSNWVDNFYLLIGKSYLMQKEFDSAFMTFQFINYNLFPHKKNDDAQLIVGTNENGDGTISIANKENRNIVNKVFTLPPSRNDALVWQVRTLIEQKEYSDAAGLINTLQNDQNFPTRLKADLEEVNAYWFYKQNIYDSAATHLEKALSAAEDKQDKARWEYLLAQLFENTKQYEKASAYYRKAMHHTSDPLLDIYANLNNAKMNKNGDEKEVNNSIANLLRMSKGGKFENYRDIVFYSAGELALDKKDTAAAMFYFKKSTSYTDLNSGYKNRAYLQLADIAYARKNYKAAYAFYDSLQTNDDALVERAKQIDERKNALSKIVEKINIIEREDSLQHIAMMSAAERETFLKTLLKKMRKENGLKDADQNSYNPSSVFDINRNQSIDIFSNNNIKGDWYFYNASVKSRGFSEFKSRWGNRMNVDNWRRKSATDVANNNFNVPNNNNNLPQNITTLPVTELSYDGLLGNVPTTAERLSISNALVATSLFELGKLYQNELEDYRIAAETYEKSLQRFPNELYGGELYKNLFYCYQKLGDQSNANFYKNLLSSQFKNSKYEQSVSNPQILKQGTKDAVATKRYENIYNLFIEGQFEKAVQEKKIADSLYGKNYWTPQLLYIESVYYIKEKQDSQAIVTLSNIISTYPASALKDKAETMIDVLKRRKQIEDYLTKLQVTRMKEDSVLVFNDEPQQKKTVRNNVIIPPKVIKQEEKKEVTPQKVNVPPPVTNGTFTIIPEVPHNVMMILDKVDPVYVSEAKNAFNRYNREKFSAQQIDITRDAIDKEKNILIFSQFANANDAMAYADRLKKNAATEISWLAANKYSFIIISDANLQVLKANKDIAGYIKLLNTKFPGKF
ncbi:MAG: tetratricopeptide repeat protein [Bacteroidota bacterium]|nr:tetratricopeptide repeat protein [Bacteroidota bacterium]